MGQRGSVRARALLGNSTKSSAWAPVLACPHFIGPRWSPFEASSNDRWCDDAGERSEDEMTCGQTRPSITDLGVLRWLPAHGSRSCSVQEKISSPCGGASKETVVLETGAIRVNIERHSVERPTF